METCYKCIKKVKFERGKWRGFFNEIMSTNSIGDRENIFKNSQNF